MKILIEIESLVRSMKSTDTDVDDTIGDLMAIVLRNVNAAG
jgi:hypothetical protein